MKLLRLVLYALAVTLAGCAAPQDSAIFVTRTSLGMDVDATPVTAAIGYNRVEGYLGPRYDNGTVPAVAGSFRTNGGLFDREVRQVYATGNAALLATGSSSTVTSATFDAEYFSGDRKAMFFGTGTTFGIGMGFSETGATSFTFGMKRKELSIIPVSTTVTSTVTVNGTAQQVVHKFPSVFARLDNTTAARTPTSSDFSVRQFFATGRAAQHLANNEQVQKEFREEASRDPKAIYRDEQYLQSDMVIETLYCVSQLKDAQLPAVFANAQALGVLTNAVVLANLAGTAPLPEKKSSYTGSLRLTDPNRKELTVMLDAHQKFVCKLVEAKA